LAWALVGAAALFGCDVAEPTPEQERETLTDTASAQVGERLASALTRARRAIERVGTLAAAAPGTRAGATSAAGERERRLDDLERARAESGVDGILTDEPSGERLWAGRPIEPREIPAPRPWEDSFGAGDVIFHAGPFVRALVVTGAGPRGSTVRATVVLADPEASPLDGTVEKRWALELQVQSIRILPPASLKTPTEGDVIRTGVPRGSASPSLAVEVTPPDLDLVRKMIEARRRTGSGLRWLLGGAGAALLAFALARRLRSPPVRAVALIVGALVAREGLRLIDLPSRFPDVAPGFRNTDFGVAGLLGWFSTPGDLALSGAAILAVAVAISGFVGGTIAPRSRAGRAAAAGAALLIAAAAVAGWLRLVDAATQSRIDVFGPGALLPGCPAALLLLGLTSATAAVFVLCRATLRRMEASSPTWLRVLPRLLVAAAIAALAFAAPGESYPVWMCALVPGAAAVLGRLREGDSRPGAPSRILLTSVLATVLLVPVLFTGASDAMRADVAFQASDWILRESAVESGLDASLSRLAGDPYLAREIAGQRRAPKELALYVWLALGFETSDADGALVLIRDAEGHRITKFAMNTPPSSRLPWIDAPPAGTGGDRGDVVVERRAGTADLLRSVAGHLVVRGPDDRIVGTVSVFVPDPLAVELAGAQPRIPVRATPPGGADRERTTRALSLRLVENGRVVATNDLHASTVPPASLPAADALSQPRWFEPESAGGRPWLAMDAGPRGILVAEPLRSEREELLLGVARVVIVGVGAGVVVALVALALGLRRYRSRLQDKILTSYFVISVVPLLFLGYANWREASTRAEDEFRRRQEVLVRTARDDFRMVGASETPGSDTTYDAIQSEAVALYRHGELDFTGLPDLVFAELLPERLSSDAFRALEIEQRESWIEPSTVGGTHVRTAYAPMRGGDGSPFAAVAVPMRYDPTRAEQQASETGSVLLAAYLLTLVLVVVIGIYTARTLARPLRDLVAGTRRVAAGELSTAIPGAGRDEMGQLVEGFNSMTRDLAATRELAARAERETAWRGMARQVAHEIKNPLTPMKLLLQQLAATAKSDPAFVASMIEPTSKVVLEQIDALSRIANDFAAFARFPPRSVEEIDVNEVLRGVVALYGTGETASAEVRAELGEGLAPVRWDEDELRRVFVNLVANAVQALDEAKGRVHVVVRSTHSKVPGSGRDAVLVTVADDGVGIPPENRSRLFEPDFSTKTHGTGLGLAICRRIVTDLSGEIRIDSTPGQGTTVSTWIPVGEPPPTTPGPRA